MEQDWVVLAHLWQRRGFMFMPPYIAKALAYAFILPADQPYAEKKPDLFLFRERCLKYDNSDQVQAILQRASEQGYPLYRPVFDKLTVNSIEVNLSKYPDMAIRLLPSVPEQKTIWRWKYWYPAFTIFWAHIYHTENEWLRRPALLWQELEEIRKHVLGSEHTLDDYHYYLALYERMLGVQHDIRTNAPHYVANIPNRIELKPAEQKERVILFANAVAYLRDEVEKRLLEVN